MRRRAPVRRRGCARATAAVYVRASGAYFFLISFMITIAATADAYLQVRVAPRARLARRRGSLLCLVRHATQLLFGSDGALSSAPAAVGHTMWLAGVLIFMAVFVGTMLSSALTLGISIASGTSRHCMRWLNLMPAERASAPPDHISILLPASSGIVVTSAPQVTASRRLRPTLLLHGPRTCVRAAPALRRVRAAGAVTTPPRCGATRCCAGLVAAAASASVAGRPARAVARTLMRGCSTARCSLRGRSPPP